MEATVKMRIGRIDLSNPASFDVALDLGPWGWLHIRGRDQLLLTPRSDGPFTLTGRDLLQAATCLHYALDERSGRVLLVGEEGEAIYLLDIGGQALTEVARMHRWTSGNLEIYDPGGLHSLHLIDTDGSVLAVYECGLVSLDLSGSVRWHREHACFSLFRGVRSGVAWFEPHDPAEAAREPEWGYRVEDGERVVPATSR